MPLADILALTPDQLTILYVILFLGVMLLVESLTQLVLRSRQDPQARVNRRLRLLQEGVDRQEVLRRLKGRPNDAEKPAPFDPVPRLEALILASGVDLSVRRCILIMIGLALVATVIFRLSAFPYLAAASLGAGLGVALPVLFLRLRKKKRVARFAAQLPEAIDLIVRSLRAGHPLNAGLAMVAEELPDPVGSEFGIVIDETTYGLDLRESVANLGKRIDLPDLHYLTIALRIHYGTGGNLAEILDNLSKLIRGRFHMFRKVRATTAEGRLSAWFLSLFPIVMALILMAIKSDYYTPIREDAAFPWIAGVTIGLLVVNILVMRWLVNIKI